MWPGMTWRLSWWAMGAGHALCRPMWGQVTAPSTMLAPGLGRPQGLTSLSPSKRCPLTCRPRAAWLDRNKCKRSTHQLWAEAAVTSRDTARRSTLATHYLLVRGDTQPGEARWPYTTCSATAGLLVPAESLPSRSCVSVLLPRQPPWAGSQEQTQAWVSWASPDSVGLSSTLFILQESGTGCVSRKAIGPRGGECAQPPVLSG